MLTTIKNEIKKLRGAVYHRIYTSRAAEQQTIEDFRRLYYDSGPFEKTWRNTFWLKVPTFKCPLDLWIYQEIIAETKPDWIIETGTASGGSGLFLASMCDLVGNGLVLTIDIQDKVGRPQHKRLEYLLGSSTSEDILQKVKKQILSSTKVLVILDSDHSKEHVLNELNAYQAFIPKGGYLIVEDTIVNGHPSVPDFGPGPMEAVDEFLLTHKDFAIDDSKEKLLMTFNPRGYLKKL